MNKVFDMSEEQYEMIKVEGLASNARELADRKITVYTASGLFFT